MTKSLIVSLLFFIILSACANFGGKAVRCRHGNAAICLDAYEGLDMRDKADEDGIKLLELGCNGRNIQCCEKLGLLNEQQGRTGEAITEYQRACALGEQSLCEYSEYLKLQSERNAKIANAKHNKISELDMACINNKNANACYQVGILAFDGQAYKPAKTYFVKGCLLSHDMSCNKVTEVTALLQRQSEQIEEVRYRQQMWELRKRRAAVGAFLSVIAAPSQPVKQPLPTNSSAPTRKSTCLYDSECGIGQTCIKLGIDHLGTCH